MTVKERFEALQAVTQKYLDDIAPLVDGLGPYIEAAKQAKALGLTAQSSADEVIEAFANSVSISPQAALVLPTVLQAGGPGEIERAIESVLAGKRELGIAVGSILGIVAGFAGA